MTPSALYCQPRLTRVVANGRDGDILLSWMVCEGDDEYDRL